MVYHPIDYLAARRAGLYRREYQKKGITLSISDTLIAAVAVENCLTWLTKNVPRFPMPEPAVIEHNKEKSTYIVSMRKKLSEVALPWALPGSADEC